LQTGSVTIGAASFVDYGVKKARATGYPVNTLLYQRNGHFACAVMIAGGALP
jgi:hypothetical protein